MLSSGFAFPMPPASERENVGYLVNQNIIKDCLGKLSDLTGSTGVSEESESVRSYLFRFILWMRWRICGKEHAENYHNMPFN